MNRRLVKLLGWKVWQGVWSKPRIVLPYSNRTISLALDKDLNALAHVWRELKERGLWDDFLSVYEHGCQAKVEKWMDYMEIYAFLTDPKGQVEAAMEVLEKANRGER